MNSEEVRWMAEKVGEDLAAMRKKGIDVTIQRLEFMQIAPKIKMALATEKQEDWDKVGKMISELQAELRTIASGEKFDVIICEQRIVQTKEAIGRKDFKAAMLLYNQLREHYKLLTDEQREGLKIAAHSVAEALSKARGT